MGSKAKSFDGLTALLGRTGEGRYRLAKEVGEEEHKRKEERRVEEQKKVEEEEEEERKRKASKEEEEKKKREEKEERLGRRKGQGKFPGLSVSRLLKITPFKKIVAAKNLYFDIYTTTPNNTGIVITNAINKISTMTEIMSRSQILRRHTTYDKGKAVHIHSWHRQVAISINNNINIAIIIMYHIMATKIWALLT